MRAIVIEDETVIRNGMVRHIPWENLEIDKVDAASNAEEALVLCRNNMPDIIISDICMPGMNGVELCKRLKEHFPDAEIIFVTGFAEKEYLKAAIELQAVRFVEKPINRDNIMSAVREAVQRVKNTRRQRAASLHSFFLDYSHLPLPASPEDAFCVGMIHLKEKEFLTKVKERLMESLAVWMRENETEFLSESFNETTVVILMKRKNKVMDREAFYQAVSEEVKGLMEGVPHWFLAFGKPVERVENISDSHQSAIYVSKALAFMGWNKVALPEMINGEYHKIEPDRRLPEQLADMIAGQNITGAIKLLDNFYRQLVEKQIFLNGDIRYLYYAFNQVIDRAEQTFLPGNVSRRNEQEAEDFFEHAETFEEFHGYVCGRIRMISGENKEQKSTYLVKKVMDYIWDNYGNSSISIKVLADHVYLTPTYLSNLFKKSTGITIGQYLVDVRVENAKRLMKNPQLKFYQVADMVGYEDAGYFAKIFKRKTGVTPSEYKESLSLK